MTTRSRPPIRVLIVDQDALQRDLLRMVLSQASGLVVVGAFADGSEVVRDAVVLAPQVAVLDVDQRGQNGFQLALKLQRRIPDLGVVFLVGSRDMGFISTMAPHSLPAWCYYVNKSSHNVTTLLRAIQVTHARLHDLGDVDVGQYSLVPRHEGAHLDLTARQLEILGLVAEGLTNRAVAEMLHLKEKTVENQLAAIYGRMHVEMDRAVVHPRVWAALHYQRATHAAPRSAAAAQGAPVAGDLPVKSEPPQERTNQTRSMRTGKR